MGEWQRLISELTFWQLAGYCAVVSAFWLPFLTLVGSLLVGFLSFARLIIRGGYPWGAPGESGFDSSRREIMYKARVSMALGTPENIRDQNRIGISFIVFFASIAVIAGLNFLSWLLGS
ncbi:MULTISPECIES: hypothetical protein [unclassified Rhizobium]|uniref:hypothetical protein n=1 Tax=unclassified Rhizobium TaxID=2613769 RepID=UPI000715C409|nr:MULTISPECIES: hypothetical protein [unclassified Rhizobium]KQS96304.1 hypothetical protein ASG50_04360 [Rhizobium sp. Leaf386]KQT06143.1 hypothetical protein ASG42_00605 [Rhizobium sp. Leaf391]KQU09621.1 hypothetical protein ASG68_01015 [Rhizobium sp. Leaf453]